MSEKKKILILGSGGSAGINFTRSVKKHFYTIGIEGSKYNFHLSETDLTFPQEANLNKQMDDLVKKYDIVFIHSQPDKMVEMLARANGKTRGRKLLPSIGAILNSQDKWMSFKKLHKANVNVPDTIQFRDATPKKLKAMFASYGSLWIRCDRGAGGKGSLLVNNYKELMNWVDYCAARGTDKKSFIISEYLPGREVSWQSVWHKGELICSTARERLGWLGGHTSASGVSGTTAYQRIIKGESFNEVGMAAVKAIDECPNGIYAVDMKENLQGKPAVMEINPGRFSTTCNFMNLAGCNMAKIYCELGIYGKLKDKSPKKLDSCRLGYYCIRAPDSKFVVKKLDGHN